MKMATSLWRLLSLFLVLQLLLIRPTDSWMMPTGRTRQMLTVRRRTNRASGGTFLTRDFQRHLSLQEKEEQETPGDVSVQQEKDDEPRSSPPVSIGTEKNDFDMDEFLDTPFFDPDRVLEDETSNPWLKRLASFVVNDYERAEAVLTGAFFVLLIIVAQEVLRMQLYGENYEPFARSVQPGSLF